MPGIKRKRSDKDVPNDAQREMVNDINNLSSSWRRRLGLHPAPSDEGMIRLVSDCAGYGSDLIALRLLDLQNRFQVVMTSEVAKDKRILHSSVATACGWSDGHGESVSDIMTRNDLTAPRADLYVAGYPCPSFSRLGKRQGARDQRGFVTLKGLKYIAASRPRALILEQVSELQQAKHKRVWEFIQKILTRLNYAFVWKVLSPKHFAVPQSRPRTYVVAVARESLRTRELTLPAERPHCSDLHHFLDKTVVGSEKLDLPVYEEKLGSQMWERGWVLDVGSSPSFQHPLKNLCPCLTKTRQQQGGYYVTRLRRRLLVEEAGRLQSVPQQVLKQMVQAANDANLRQRAVDAALGDGMSVAVLMSALGVALDGSGMTSTMQRKRDYWLRVPCGSAAAQMSDRPFDKTSK